MNFVPASAQIDSEFTKIEGNEIQTNPQAQTILDKIEESKRILAEMMEIRPVVTEQQKLVDEQRRISQDLLDSELDRINKKYEDFTPRNAFASFIAKFNSTHHGIYWDQFEYMQEKVNLARATKQQVLNDGGSFLDAQREYIKYASMPRVDMIQKIIELNLKYNFAHKETQEDFDENGKLPRYDNDGVSICYGCSVYEKIRNDLIDKDSNPYILQEDNNLENTVQQISYDTSNP